MRGHRATASDARAIAQRLLDTFAEPFLVQDGEAFLQASIGIALSRDGFEAPEDLIRDADAAMYRAKDRGQGVELFDEAMRQDVRDRLALEAALRRGIGRGELRLHCQPLVSLADARIEGFEALVRWEHPERGLVPPGSFIPLAEETGLIVPIGAWVLREACATLRRIIDETGMATLQVSVNVSPRQLQQPDFVAQVRAALDDNGARARAAWSSRSPRARSWRPAPRPSCARSRTSACAWRWTTSAPATRRWRTCAASRST